VGTVATSTVTGEGIDELKRLLFERIPEALPAPASPGEGLADYLVYRPRPPRNRSYRVLRTDRGFLVTGRNLASVPAEEIEQALADAGAKSGDQVTIGDEVMEYVARHGRSPRPDGDGGGA
jgi:hypothetical protein